jgi:hypothetical protein
MKRSEQAVIIWAVLSLAARMQRVLTYGDIHDFTGVLAVGQAHPLHLIHLYCEKKDYPPLNSIAVNQDTGFPGDKYPGDHERLKLLSQRAQIFTFNWAIKGVPRSKDFQAVDPHAAKEDSEAGETDE